MSRQCSPVPALLAPCLVLAACAAENPYPPVPPPVTEQIMLPPVSAEAQLWRPGAWNWNGTSYVWEPGRFVPVAGHSNIWVSGAWVRRGRGWTWQPAHWQ